MINFFSSLNLNQIPVENLVFQNCTSATHPANPVGGQVIYETDTGLWKVYNAVKARWDNVSGGITFKGVVGGSSQGALLNLPTSDVLVGDMYLVDEDGNYGVSGSEQYATIGDKFIALTDSTVSTPPTWQLFNDNSKVKGTITIADGTTSYNITNTAGTLDLCVDVYLLDETNNKLKKIGVDVEITTSNITITIGSSIATSYNGEKLFVMGSNG